MKKLIPAYVLAFAISFMFYIYEPLTMYGNNVNDFWFDLYIMLKPILIAFFGLFLILSLIFTGIYFLNKKFSEKLTVYKICLIITFISFICFYIQGNYLTAGLPSLDGTNIDWKSYVNQEIISYAVIGVVSIVTIICCIKFKMDNVINVSKFISLAVVVMLTTSIVSMCLSVNLIRKKNGILATTVNYNVASSNKNFLILLVDAVDSVKFDEVMSKDKDFKNTFKDFTYYKDTMSVYGYTRDSLPLILSGKINDNTDDFATYSTKALDNSLLFEELKNREYDRNIFDAELIWDSDKSNEMSNLVKSDRGVNDLAFIKNQTKYVLFKYLPFNLKKYSKIEHMYFNNSKSKGKNDYFTWGDITNYDAITTNPIETIEQNYFHFLHLEGAHVPFGLAKDLSYSPKNGYKSKIAGTLTVINAYLERLKKYDVYDNSVIIVMADHGYSKGNGPLARQNPILFIKGIDEHHDMIRSDIPVSHLDLNDAYMDLLEGKKSTELFSEIPKKRERIYMYYEYMKENHMVEYITTGKAWEQNKLKKTGKEFNR